MGSGILEVLVVDAQGIEHDIFENIKPYLLIQYGTQKQKSEAKGEGKKKTWNEKFLFQAEYPGGEAFKYKLTLRIMDLHRQHEDVFVGETTIYLEDVVSFGVEKGKEELRLTKYRIVLPDKRYAGEIAVAVKFSSN